MSEHTAESAARNGRPVHTHDRLCGSTPEWTQLHRDHVDSVCAECGCCWGCADDCCAESFCPNKDCGCQIADRIAVATPSGGGRA